MGQKTNISRALFNPYLDTTQSEKPTVDVEDNTAQGPLSPDAIAIPNQPDVDSRGGSFAFYMKFTH